jgi:hypothetical protein
MGAWSENGDDIWLTKELHPNRDKARMFIAAETDCNFIDTRCNSVWIRPIERTLANAHQHDWWCDVLWIECKEDDEGAIPAWHIFFKM